MNHAHAERPPAASTTTIIIGTIILHILAIPDHSVEVCYEGQVLLEQVPGRLAKRFRDDSALVTRRARRDVLTYA